MIVPKDLQAAARKARKAGWEIRQVRSGHLHWVSPTGARVVTSATPGKTYALRRQLADLKRAGLVA
jgi:hypothetical protein